MKIREVLDPNNAHTEWVAQGKPVYLGHHLDGKTLNDELGVTPTEFAEVLANDTTPVDIKEFMKLVFERPKEVGIKEPTGVVQYEDVLIMGDNATGLWHIWS